MEKGKKGYDGNLNILFVSKSVTNIKITLKDYDVCGSNSSVEKDLSFLGCYGMLTGKYSYFFDIHRQIVKR
jgi:hypothetical protein